MPQRPFPLKPILLTAGGFVVLEQAISNLASLHTAVAPTAPWLANLLTVTLGLATLGLVGSGGYWVWVLAGGKRFSIFPAKQQKRNPKTSTQLLKVTPERVERELGNLDELLEKLQNDIARRSLRQQAKRIGRELAANQLRLVVFGTSSAGKTSLVNALLGHRVGDTAPTLGTTQAGAIHTYAIPGVGGKIEIADTPGLQAVGLTGESEAVTLAKHADLLMFVVSGDMTATEYEQLRTLAEIGKRMVVVLNKTDQYVPSDVQEIVDSLQSKTDRVMPSGTVVKVAADPVPIKVRRHEVDGTIVETYAERLPDTQELTAQLGRVLKREGTQLRLANALQKARSLASGAEAAIASSRRSRAEQVIQRMQWTTAAAIAVNPVPVLDLLAAAAINARTIGKLHAIYNRKISLKRAEQMAKSFGQVMLKIGGVEVATQVLGSALKASPLMPMGVSLQALSCAYLTRVAGASYLDWLESDTPWDEETMLDRVKTQLQLGSRTEFIETFLRQAAKAAKRSLLPTQTPQTPEAIAASSGGSNEVSPVPLPRDRATVQAS
ncbi:YcjF family protein [Synechococcus sp. PCC 7336]|uniref:YcjF family protein n=1 Tax=Synechococcus sp. PCC 7336 TaxID=195250 RepID=UPI00034D5889|nr:GTP-binding protein [Synechococcus sp. PCC 7336]